MLVNVARYMTEGKCEGPLDAGPRREWEAEALRVNRAQAREKWQLAAILVGHPVAEQESIAGRALGYLAAEQESVESGIDATCHPVRLVRQLS
jgi:hypothetical protein